MPGSRLGDFAPARHIPHGQVGQKLRVFEHSGSLCPLGWKISKWAMVRRMWSQTRILGGLLEKLQERKVYSSPAR